MSLGLRHEQYMGGEGRSRGKDFELDLFGLPRVGDPKYREGLEKVQNRESNYVPFRAALELVSKIQPTKYRPFAIKLTHKIAEVLGKNHNFDNSRVRFYTTVDTPLDKFHGADAIIEIRREGIEPIQVRLGATTVDGTVKFERQSKEPDVEIEEKWLNLEDEETLNNQKKPEIAARVISSIEEKMTSKKAA